MSVLNSQVDLRQVPRQPSSATIGSRSSSAARLANRVRQTSNTLQTNGSRRPTGGNTVIQKNGGLEDMINKVDLSYLSEEERAKVLGVVQRDLAVRAVEKERLKRCRSSILRHDRELAEKSQTTVAESTNCLLCGQKFVVLFQPRRVCANCSRSICRRCSEPVPNTDSALCKLCVKETGYRAMKCNWFYDTVINKFREFGSTAVAKNIFGDKYKHIQSMAEEELALVLSRHGSSVSDNREFVVNDQKVAPQSVEHAKDAQVVQLRTKLQTLMQNTAKEYKMLEDNNNLTEYQKNWQFGRIGVEFRREAVSQMRAFCRAAYIATERHLTIQGANSRNITKQVMTTLRDEVGQLVGHPIEVVEDRQNLLLNGTTIRPQNSSIIVSSAPLLSETTTIIPNVQERIAVIEGSPTRMEMKIPFDEKSEFSWLRENAQGNRVPVKFDFHAEHVITGSVDPTGRENFVLSNSGHYSEEARQSLIKANQDLLTSGAPHGVIIQHQLIIWAAKLDDAGRYFAVVRNPTGDGVTAMQETEFRLEVERAPRWPIHPLHPPEFIQPLSLQNARTSAGAECLELSCTVASNPTPRCLFYKNNSPVPVVILPPLNSEQDMSEITLSSFSRKYAVISCPPKQKVASISLGYLRELVLRISSPTNEDVASYTCRAWNYNGRTETSVKVSASDLSARDRLRSADSQPSSLSERVFKTQTAVLNSAKNVENTATTHGDILRTNRPIVNKPPPSPTRIIIENESQNRIFEVAEQSMSLHSRVLDLERRFYTHSCSSTGVHDSVPTRSSSRGITRPFRMCMGHKPRAKAPQSLTERPNVCDELRSELNDLVEDVFTNEERIRSLSAGNPGSKEFPENQTGRDSAASSISSSYRPIYVQPNPKQEVKASTASLRQNRPRAPAINTFTVSTVRDHPRNTLESQHSRESVTSPISDAGSDISSFAGSPFQRNSLRRSSAPKIVVDRRSQRRRSRSKASNSVSQWDETTEL
ncbi:Rab effector MyRIP [Fasciola hepatica]|uniref:Rab effector MyRIP n=1 Tax=Fasciola hepatica TaxID=6192 RepID=A0A4E0RXT5_FASHE|nr:Rab effector MyRIP [Fasciola hepatica]